MLHILYALTEDPDRLWGLLSVPFAGYRRLFPRVIRLGREADQSRSYSFEVKMSVTIPTLSHTHSRPAKRRLLYRYGCSNWGSTIFEVLTAVAVKITVVWDVICDVVDTSCQRFGRACCLHLCRGYVATKRLPPSTILLVLTSQTVFLMCCMIQWTLLSRFAHTESTKHVDVPRGHCWCCWEEGTSARGFWNQCTLRNGIYLGHRCRSLQRSWGKK